MRWIKQSTSVELPIGPFLDDTDGKTAETALTLTQPDIRLKKNGAAWAQKNAAQTLAHEENGNYEVTLDATDTNTLGLLRLHVAESGALPVWDDFLVVPANVYDSLVGGSDTLQADVTQFGGIANGATGGLSGAIVRGGTAQAGAAGTITLDTSASGTDDFYNGQLIYIVSGTGAGQSRVISDYVGGTTKVASVGSNWAETPNSSSVFVILPLPGVIAANTPANFSSLSIDGSGRVDVAKVSGTTQTAGDIIGDTNDIQARLPAALVGGRMDSNASAVNNDATAAANLAKTTRVIGRGTVGGSATTTSIPTSAFSPAGAAADQFKGRIVTFDADTTTAALRGQATDITASTNAATPTLTITALTTAPVSGDTFSVT